MTTLTLPTLLEAVAVKNESSSSSVTERSNISSRKKELVHRNHLHQTYQFADSPILNIKTIEPQPRMIHKANQQATHRVKSVKQSKQNKQPMMNEAKGEKKGKYSFDKNLLSQSKKKAAITNPELFR